MSRQGWISAAIDFGTTFSLWAFSFTHDFTNDKTNIKTRRWKTYGNTISEKAPTCILLNPDGSFHSFGYEAERMFANLTKTESHREWYYFRRFKMQLYRKHLDRHFKLKDETGKEMSALKVFSLLIKFLKNDVLSTLGLDVTEDLHSASGNDQESKAKNEESTKKFKIKEEEIQWVLTVPAIWDDAAKQFMREAAKEAGIRNENLYIGLEPEAGSIYCRCLPPKEIKGSFSGMEPGSKYMIFDAGGGTVDITVHELCDNGRLKERHRASGGHWGGTRVDEEFYKFFEELCGKGILAKLKEKHMEEYLELCAEFEVKKRLAKSDLGEKVSIKIPVVLDNLIEKMNGLRLKQAIQKNRTNDKVIMVADKLRIDFDVFEGFFKFSIDESVKKVSEILQHPDVRGCNKILMIGGFSDALLLQNAMVKNFPEHEIVIPIETELCIIKGAVIFGHDPSFIAERKLKRTYGTAVVHVKSDKCAHPPGETMEIFDKVHCIDLFHAHVHAGQIVKVGEEQEEKVYSPVHPLAPEATVRLYSSTDTHPTFVTDDSCECIGNATIRLTPSLLSLVVGNQFGVTFLFGGTEIKVKVVDYLSGEKKELFLEYPDERNEAIAGQP